MAAPNPAVPPPARSSTPAPYGSLVTRAAWPDPLFEDDLCVVLRFESPGAAMEWVVRERLPTIRVNGRVAVRRQALVAALRACEVRRG